MLGLPKDGILFAALALTVGCAGGDLTLPGTSGPAELNIVSGNGQEAETGTVLDDPLIVEVLDEASEPLPGARVEFGFLGETLGAVIDPASVLTDEDGRASAVVRLGTVAGDQLILAQVASAEEADLSARFVVTALEPEDEGGGNGKGKKGRGKGGD